MEKEGNWHDSIDGIVEYFSTYLTRILEVLDIIPTKVTKEMNQLLIKEFTREEIEVALNQMHPIKAPGPNGMSAIFFQKY